MPSAWKDFYIYRVTLALAVIFVAGQGVAMALRDVPLRRSYMDDLALAVEHDHTAHRVVLLGDSITLMATRRFQLGRGPNDVVNLATIAWTGAAAELFLLERYLSSHPPPQYVIYASAADDLKNSDSPQLIHYYDWNVYTKPQERAFLREYVRGIDEKEHWPAVLGIQENILERLLSIAARSPPVMPSAVRLPDPGVQTEPPEENRMGGPIEYQRMHQKLILGKLQVAVFKQICQLSQQYGFKFSIVWPPLPPSIRTLWDHENQFELLNRQIQGALGHDCKRIPIFDVNTLHTYTNFNRDGFHLRGSGWEERYAADLAHYIGLLPDRQTTAETEFPRLGKNH